MITERYRRLRAVFRAFPEDSPAKAVFVSRASALEHIVIGKSEQGEYHTLCQQEPLKNKSDQKAKECQRCKRIYERIQAERNS